MFGSQRGKLNSNIKQTKGSETKYQIQTNIIDMSEHYLNQETCEKNLVKGSVYMLVVLDVWSVITLNHACRQMTSRLQWNHSVHAKLIDFCRDHVKNFQIAHALIQTHSCERHSPSKITWLF